MQLLTSYTCAYFNYNRLQIYLNISNNEIITTSQVELIGIDGTAFGDGGTTFGDEGTVFTKEAAGADNNKVT